MGQSGIKIWVLTGDKVETAINIGRSCNLLTAKMRGKNLLVVDIDESLADAEAKVCVGEGGTLLFGLTVFSFRYICMRYMYIQYLYTIYIRYIYRIYKKYIFFCCFFAIVFLFCLFHLSSVVLLPLALSFLCCVCVGVCVLVCVLGCVGCVCVGVCVGGWVGVLVCVLVCVLCVC